MSTTESVPGIAERSNERATAIPWRVGVLAFLLTAAYLPLLSAHAQQLWLRPHYRFFPLVLVGSIVLALSRLKELGELSPGSRRCSYLLVAVALVLSAAGVVLYSSWLGAIALLIMLAAVLFGIGGGALLRRLLPAWGFLWLVIPPPLELDRELILSLQTLTARVSSSVLDLVGIWHVMSGHVVEIGGRRLLVEEACSGINSLFSVLASTLFFVLWVRRPPVRAVFLLLSAVAWVLLSNVVRVVALTYLSTRCGIDFTEGSGHDAFGLLLFALALVLIWSSDRFFEFLAAPTEPSEPEAERGARGAGRAAPPRPPPPPPPPPPLPVVRLPDLRETWLCSWPVAGAFAILILTQHEFFGLGKSQGSLSSDGVAPCLASLEADTMAARWGHWQRLAFAAASRNPGSSFGEFSRTWNYQLGQNTAVLSLDYPFPGWHDLTRCYTSQGWTILEQRVHEETGEGATAGYVEVKMTKPAHNCAYLLFSQLDQGGSVLEPRRGGAYLAVYRHAASLRRWRSPWSTQEGAPADARPPTYQLQLFVETYTPLTAPEESEAQAFFLESLSSLRRQWAGTP
jgi:exosortase